MKQYFIYGFFALLILLVAWASHLGNPKGLSFDRDYYEVIDGPVRSPASRLKNRDSSCEATSQYRHDIHRTGVAPSANPRIKVEIKSHMYPLNVDIHSASKSSPTIDDTGVYIGSDAGWFWKMDHDGKKLWSFYVPGSDNGIHGTAAVDDKKVYIGAYNGFMYALDKETGELVWANPVGNFIGASPLLAGGHLYISAETYHPDGLVAKLDCNSGETLWVSKWLGGHSHSSPTYDEKNKLVMVGANSGRFYAFKEDSGEVAWEKQFHGQIKGTAMIWEDSVFFSSWDKNYHAHDLATGEEKWVTFLGGRNQTSLSLIPGASVGVANTKMGDIIGLNLKNGNILWRLRHGDQNHMSSALITENPSKKGSYLAWSRCKEFQICVLDGKSGALLHNVELPGSFTSVPVAYGNKVYISLDNDRGLVILE